MDKKETIKTTLFEILEFININPKVLIEDGVEETVTVTIEGDNLNFLIGYRGESLDALQTILNIMMYKKESNFPRVIVDINGYRKQRQEKIEQITKSFIDRVRFFRKEVEMPPMNPFERRFVHTFVSNYDDISSESIGEKSERRVVLKLK